MLGDIIPDSRATSPGTRRLPVLLSGEIFPERQMYTGKTWFAQLMDLAFTPLRVMLGSAVLSAGFVILWAEAFWRHCL